MRNKLHQIKYTQWHTPSRWHGFGWQRAVIVAMCAIGLFGSGGTTVVGQVPTDSVALSLQLTVKVPELLDFSLDAVGNLYVLTEKNTIEKYDATGKKRSQFSQNQLGAATAINAANALKILVWYADFRTVVFLDRSLTQLGGELNLIQWGFPEVRTVAPASDGNLWIYDEVAFKLRKINPQGEQLVESQNLSLLMDNRLSIHHIVDDGSRIIATDTTKGCMVFDVFGQFQKQITASDLSVPVQLEGNNLRWIGKSGLLHQINLDFVASEKSWILPSQFNNSAIKRLFLGGIAINTVDGIALWR